MLVALRTDTDIAEVYLLDSSGETLQSKRWEAGRKLSTELLAELKQLLVTEKTNWDNLTGVVVYEGPGSFTGLRIGVTVANTIAYAQSVAIVGTRGDDWLAEGVKRLKSGKNDRQVLPFYGREANITRPGGRA